MELILEVRSVITLHLPDRRLQHWRDALPDLLTSCPAGRLDLHCGDWSLTCTDIRDLQRIVEVCGRQIHCLETTVTDTVVSAAAIGLESRLWGDSSTDAARESAPPGSLTVHQGTLRSGDHLQSDGSLLVVGDVNPGARISAAADVMVWGRLRGVAHAGRDGAREARIVSLHLRPLQLRIADVVARGPEDQPVAGMAEQARLVDGEIVIEPADPQAMART